MPQLAASWVTLILLSQLSPVAGKKKVHLSEDCVMPDYLFLLNRLESNTE